MIVSYIFTAKAKGMSAVGVYQFQLEYQTVSLTMHYRSALQFQTCRRVNNYRPNYVCTITGLKNVEREATLLMYFSMVCAFTSAAALLAFR